MTVQLEVCNIQYLSLTMHALERICNFIEYTGLMVKKQELECV